MDRKSQSLGYHQGRLQMGNKNMKDDQHNVIRESQMKTTRRYCYTAIGTTQL